MGTCVGMAMRSCDWLGGGETLGNLGRTDSLHEGILAKLFWVMELVSQFLVLARIAVETSHKSTFGVVTTSMQGLGDRK